MNGTEQMNRWRLILGKQAKDQISFGDGGWLEGGISCNDLEDALDFLYSREIRRRCAAGRRHGRKPADRCCLDHKDPPGFFPKRPWRSWRDMRWTAISSPNF